jgi:hypothetical protein
MYQHVRLQHPEPFLRVLDLLVQVLHEERHVRDGRARADDVEQDLHVLLLGRDLFAVRRFLDRDADVLSGLTSGEDRGRRGVVRQERVRGLIAGGASARGATRVVARGSMFGERSFCR